jgi:hypothetical protein
VNHILLVLLWKKHISLVSLTYICTWSVCENTSDDATHRWELITNVQPDGNLTIALSAIADFVCQHRLLQCMPLPGLLSFSLPPSIYFSSSTTTKAALRQWTAAALPVWTQLGKITHRLDFPKIRKPTYLFLARTTLLVVHEFLRWYNSVFTHCLFYFEELA